MPIMFQVTQFYYQLNSLTHLTQTNNNPSDLTYETQQITNNLAQTNYINI